MKVSKINFIYKIKKHNKIQIILSLFEGKILQKSVSQWEK